MQDDAPGSAVNSLVPAFSVSSIMEVCSNEINSKYSTLLLLNVLMERSQKQRKFEAFPVCRKRGKIDH